MEERVCVGGKGDVATGLTRGQVAQELGVSVSAVRRMEGKLLHPRLVAGMWAFDPGEVSSLRKAAKPVRRPRSRSDGDISAEVFQRFDQGQSLRQIVEDLRQPPDRIRTLFREWSTPLDDEPASSTAILPDDDGDLKRWETAMRDQIAAEEQLDRQDRELRVARRKDAGRPARQA